MSLGGWAWRGQVRALCSPVFVAAKACAYHSLGKSSTWLVALCRGWPAPGGVSKPGTDDTSSLRPNARLPPHRLLLRISAVAQPFRICVTDLPYGLPSLPNGPPVPQEVLALIAANLAEIRADPSAPYNPLLDSLRKSQYKRRSVARRSSRGATAGSAARGGRGEHDSSSDSDESGKCDESDEGAEEQEGAVC